MQPPETQSPVDTGREEDWGIAPTRSGLSRETKMGFAFVLVLLVVFGFVVYKKIEQGRAQRGDLLAGVQEPAASSEGTTPESGNSTAEQSPSAETPNANNNFPPDQNFNQFPEPTPVANPSELTPASWDQQSFEPPSQSEVASTPPAAPPEPPSQSFDQFPADNPATQEFAPPVETATSTPFPPDAQYQTTAEPQPQTTTVATQAVPEPDDFAPPAVSENQSFTQTSTTNNNVPATPFPDNEFAQAPVPPGFEPPTEMGNQPVPQEIPRATPGSEAGTAGGDPFAGGGIPQQTEPAAPVTEFENEQFTTQSQPAPQEFTPPMAQETAQTPAAGNPFGDFSLEEQGKAAPSQSEIVQTPPAVPGNSADPFAATQGELQPEPVPVPNTVEQPFAPTEITEAAPSTPVEMIPVKQASPGTPEQNPPITELAQPNPLPVQDTEPKELPIADNSNYQDLEPVPTDSQYEPETPQETTIVQLPVNSAPTELADNSFGPAPGSQHGGEFSPASNVASSSEAVEVYEVRPGDNYWKISKKQYGTVRYFSALARYNQKRIPDPKKMRPGMKVLTPSREVLEANNPDLFPKFAAKTSDVSNVGHDADGPTGFYVDAQGRPMYRVGPDDTLGGIAHKHLGRFSRWTEIYRLNRHRLKDPNALTLGDLLILPPDASRVSMVQHASGVR